MSRKWTLLTLILSLGSSGTLHANPLDSPGTVYIDGLPCNRACQSYMAWSRSASAQHREVRETSVVVPAEVETARMDHAARPRVARQAVPVSRPAPRAGMANSNIRPSSTRALHSKKAATARPAHQATAKAAPVAAAAVVPEKIEGKISTGGQAPAQAASIPAPPRAESAGQEVTRSDIVKSDVALPPPATLEIAAAPSTEEPRPEIAKSETAASPAADAVPASRLRTIEQQVAEATGMAERLTAITLERESADNPDNQDAKSIEAGDADTTASTSPASPVNLVALVLARPEVNSLSDLNDRRIAIGEKQTTASRSVSAALMTAGVAEVRLSEGQAGAIDRLIGGEVPAAIMMLASPEAAEWFPDIEGFRIFRLPLSQRARL